MEGISGIWHIRGGLSPCSACPVLGSPPIAGTMFPYSAIAQRVLAEKHKRAMCRESAGLFLSSFLWTALKERLVPCSRLTSSRDPARRKKALRQEWSGELNGCRLRHRQGQGQNAEMWQSLRTAPVHCGGRKKEASQPCKISPIGQLRTANSDVD